MYIYQYPKWPQFSFEINRILPLLEKCHVKQGRLMCLISFLSEDQKNALSAPSMFSFDHSLTEDGLFQNYSRLLLEQYNGLPQTRRMSYRRNSFIIEDSQDNVLFEAPHFSVIQSEMKQFLKWFNGSHSDLFLSSAIAHFWFVTIHPFDEANSRLACGISDQLLARSDGSSRRFYSASSVLQDKSQYSQVLAKNQSGYMDITEWILWFLEHIEMSLQEAVEKAGGLYENRLKLQEFSRISMNERQIKVVNELLEGKWSGELKVSSYGQYACCSTDTALRDLNDLVKKNILCRSQDKGGRSTSYFLR